MPRLLLVRHAEAVAHAPEGDLGRQLTAQGRADAARMGAYFGKSGLAPDLALASPARRTRDTLEAILRELPRELAHEVKPSLYNADSDTLQDLMTQTPDSVQTLLIVGHNPGVAEFTRVILSGQDSADPLPRSFPAPCLAVIDLSCATWQEAGTARARLDRFMSFSNMSEYNYVSRSNKIC